MGDETQMERYGWETPVPQSEHSEGDVNIQCIQSSEFVVGKQTNFNGPVTIINCLDSKDEGKDGKVHQLGEEKVVIRNEVLSESLPTMPGKEEKPEAAPQSKQKLQKLAMFKLGKSSVVWLLVVVAILTTTVFGLAVFFTLTGEEPQNEPHRFYSKKDWGGKPPKSVVEMKLPVPYAVVSHSVTTQCFHLKACSLLIQNMQNYHLGLDFADISYNFLVDSSGNIYEGRGWSNRNPKGGFVNGRNIDVGLIGDFSDAGFPTEELMDGLRYLLEFGVENNKISKTYSLLAANSTYATLSPGKNIYAIIKDWPHFDPDPKSHVQEYED